MKPKQLGLMAHPATGHIFIVARKPDAKVRLKDVTVDFVMMLLAEILDEDADGIQREFVATDSDGNQLELRVTTEIISARKIVDTP